jgi:2-dehydro-3-deoxygluconokinase
MILTFGEIMLRINPVGRLRLRQSIPGSVNITLGGGEANVAASLAMLGLPARYVTALPANVIGDSVVGELRGAGIDTGAIVRTKKGRVGIYFVEAGANQRSSVVVYDRDGSSIALTPPEDYAFDQALAGVTWAHVTGITPAISEAAYRATLALVTLAKARGLTVSCDLNFRKKLWNWRPGTGATALAKECMTALMPFVDVAIANEEDAKDVFGIEAAGTSVESGQINAQAYRSVAEELVRRFPSIKQVAITLRESYSADHNNWGGMLYDAAARQAYLAPLDAQGQYKPYEIRDIVDRVGGGDSFCAGLIFALNTPKYRDPQTALRFAVAASCLKHSIEGDFNVVSEDEVAVLMAGSGSGRVRR